MKIPPAIIGCCFLLGLASPSGFSQVASSTPAPSPSVTSDAAATPPTKKPDDHRQKWIEETHPLEETAVIIGDEQNVAHFYVGKDVIVRGKIQGSLDITSGDVFVFGEVAGPITVQNGNLTVFGTVNGNVEVDEGNLRLAGTVNGSATITQGKLVKTDDAHLNGASEVSDSSSVSTSDLPEWDFFPKEFSLKHFIGSGIFVDTIWNGVFALMAFILILPIAFLWSDHVEFAARYINAQPLRHLFVGLLFWIAFGILMISAILACIVVIGFPFVFLLIAVAVAVLWYGYTIVYAWIGRSVLQRTRHHERGTVFAVLIGLLIATIIGFIPIIGFLIGLVLGMIGAGATILNLLECCRPRLGPPASPAPSSPGA